MGFWNKKLIQKRKL